MPRFLIDTDGGIDDALALLYALNSPDATIEAITTVHGNVPLQQATRNVFEVLAIAGAKTLVATGAEAPLEAAAVHAHDVHGDDGLSGWTVGRPVVPIPAHRLPTALRLLCAAQGPFHVLPARSPCNGSRA